MDDDDKYDPVKFRRNGASADKAAQLPGLTTPYKAAGTPDNGELPRLVLVMGRDGFRAGNTAYVSLPYQHLGIGQFSFTDDGQVFTFPVSDLMPKRLTVFGRDLLRMFDLISLRRLPWIRQIDRDFRLVVGDGPDEPVITKIELEDWSRE